ncbi:hypothetical protein AK830_g7156 [Neonectria ditissima]|uniref:FAD-binding PCMH-type domain-containing protein n=1 Tax=Neonectria ditissima TaxID=78410 RepID=A0A0P7BAR5_9HYPO|nr:hypothetical protein AK830_g7156 [Neonectria ditissima]
MFYMLTALLALVAAAAAAPSRATTKACNELSDSLSDHVSFPLSLSFHRESNAYWSTVLRDEKPACIVFPKSADHVSTAVKILNQYPSVKFTVKSGGHDPNPDHATVPNGVLISMRDISGASYDSEKNVAYVKPGGEWNEVISSLEEESVTVVGGRLGIVGVGGFLLQGGISFLSAQYGMAVDNIVGWEMVLPNGTIANVTVKDHPELAVALKGSGSQFGIATQFTLLAHQIDKVWGGIRIFTSGKRDQIFKTLHDLVPHSNEDPKGAIIVSDTIAIASTEIYIVFFFYNDASPPSSGPFADLLKVDSLIDYTSTQTYGELLKSNGFGASLLNSRISFRTLTIPHIPNNPNIYAEITDKMTELLGDYLSDPFHLTAQCSVDFQPLPSIVGKHSEHRGGNAMGLSGSDGDRLILELQCAWTDEDDDSVLPSVTKDLTDWIETKIPGWLNAKDASGESYLPLFMNDAMADQNVTGSYRDFEKFKALQLQNDPDGTLRTRVGGFKY